MIQASAAANPLALLRKLEWRVRHASENVLGGEYRSAFRGRGMEFDQVVKYEFGDDVRDIDWNVTARRGEPYRKKFVEEREVTVMVVFEDSPSLQFGSGTRTKREALLELAGLLALLGAVNRDRFSVVHVGGNPFWFRKPVRGRGAILKTAASLIGRPAPEPGSESHPIPWKFLAGAVPRHSLVLWLGDFPPHPVPEAWAFLQRRYQMMGFRVDDPWDRELPDSGPLTIFDPMHNQLMQLDPRSRAQRNHHASWKKQREAVWNSLFPDPISRLSVSTTEPLLDALVQFFHRRMHSRK